MTVYVDPQFTIDSISSAGTNVGTSTPVIRNSRYNVVSVDVTGNNTGVRLYPGAVEGDVVEFHLTPASAYTLLIYPESGGQFDDGVRPANFAVDAAIVTANFRQMFRFLNGVWRFMS